jgi:hypothetical protein
VAAPLVYYWPGKKAKLGRAAGTGEKSAVVREKVEAEKIDQPGPEKAEALKTPKVKTGKKKGRK